MVTGEHIGYDSPEYENVFTCEFCPENHYCKQGTKNECPENSTAPSHSHEIELCICLPGYEKIATDSILFECIEGAPPFYYVNGLKLSCETFLPNSETVNDRSLSTGDCLCKPGYFFDTANQTCEACTEDQYTDQHNSTSCQTCPQHSGHALQTQTTISSCQCNAGFEGLNPMWCAQCTHGKFKPTQSNSLCSDCPEGKYTDSVATHVCSDCFSNSDSVAGSTSIDSCTCNLGFEKVHTDGDPHCEQCLPGKYRDDTVSQCTQCDAGRIAPTLQSISCIDCLLHSNTSNYEICVCDAGFAGDHSFPLVECEQCVSGKYSTGGENACVACGDHTTSIPGSTSIHDCQCIEQYEDTSDDNFTITCTRCPEGKYKNTIEKDAVCLDCQSNAQPVLVGMRYECQCNAGYTANAHLCRACEKGSFKGVVGDFACEECESGKYSDVLGSIECSNCPDFSFSEPASTSSSNCHCNYGYKHHDEECVACASGKYSETYTIPDYSLGAQECLACPPHHRTKISDWPWGSASDCLMCTMCPSGQYITGTCDEMHDYACLDCPDPGSTTRSNSFNVGQSSCECKPGYEFDGTACRLCDAGKFKGVIGNQNCTICSAGQYSNTRGSTECLQCPSNMNTLPEFTEECLCDVGYTASTDASQCVECPAGKFKSTVSNISCTDCLANTWQSSTGKSSCSVCPGNLSTLGAEGSTTVDDCICDFGYGVLNTDECHACIEGQTFSDTQSSDSCQSCQVMCGQGQRVRSYCTTASQIQCIPCQAHSNSDYYVGTSEQYCACNAGYELVPISSSEKICQMCPQGKAKSIDHSILDVCQDCLAGHSFADREGQITCTSCSDECPPNHYITSACTKTSNITCLPCSNCPPGQQVDIPCENADTRDTTCMPCETGYYCPGYEHDPQSCPPNSLSPPGSTSIVHCVCIAGFELIIESYTCKECTTNTYCLDGTLFNCPEFSHSTSKSSTIDDCTCNPGYKRNESHAFFQCVQCLPGEICSGGGSTLSCPHPLMVTDSGATSVEDCFCIPGYYLTETNSCEECLENVYCTRGQVTACPSNKWTAGLTARFLSEHCLCRPGLYKDIQGNCASCPQGNYCPGNNLFFECMLPNQVPDSEQQTCVCNRGYTLKQNQCVSCVAGYYKDTIGDFDCLECTQCTEGKYISSVCAPASDVLCGVCTVCPAGHYLSTPCGLLQPGVCSECKTCNYEDEYKQIACSQTQNTICIQRDKNLLLCSNYIDRVRGKISTQAPDSCIPCHLPESTPYFGVDLHYFISHGTRYNDETSCGMTCRQGSYANPLELQKGCKSCEHVGNFLLRNMQQTQAQLPDGSMINIDCSFTCKEPYAVLNSDGTDCIRSPMSGNKGTFFSHTLDLSYYEKTTQGFKFTWTYSQYGRYMLLISKSKLACGPRDNLDVCCESAYRISHKAASGLSPESTVCPKHASVINSDDATQPTLAFTILYESLSDVAECSVSEATVTCTFIVSLLDIIYMQSISRTVEIQNNIATNIMRLHETDSYIPLTTFDAQILWLQSVSNGNIFLLQFQIQKSTDITQTVEVHVSLPGAAQLPQIPKCERLSLSVADYNSTFELGSDLALWQTALFIPTQEEQIAAIATMSVEASDGQILLSHIGLVRNVSEYILNNVPQCGKPYRAYKYEVTDAYALVGFSTNFKHLLSPYDTYRWIPDQFNYHTPGLSSHLVCFVVMPLSRGSAAIDVRRALSTHISNDLAKTVDFLYESESDLTGLEIATSKSIDRHANPLDFTFKYRQWCRLRPEHCQYEYHTTHTGTMHVLQSTNARCNQLTIPAARAWLEQNFGFASYNQQAVDQLCNFAMTKNPDDFAIVLVNTKSSSRAYFLDERHVSDASTSFVWLDASVTIL